MKAAEVRQTFIRFFEERGHTNVPPSSVVPLSDPTLLFTNAGMNQFKDVFLDTGSRPYTRAVNSQPCIRVSGKHNDLEEVGHDTYHHTLFEMLGNWSFGDYYKREAITWAWELLTDVFGIQKNKLYATVHYTDSEAASLWSKHTDIDPAHILEFGDKDNFWEMGETGPCGPCSEIHIDLGPERCDKQHDPEHTCGVNSGCARYIELWNLVFIQFNRAADGTLHDLPHKHVDTGAGLERLTAVLNSLPSNYDVDLFADIIEHIARISGVPYTCEGGVPHRVIADHIRTLTFSISDGVIPSNDGRGYVIRRLLRRAARYGRNINLTEPFLHKLVPVVVNIMGDAFPRLRETEEHVARVIKGEEESFNVTLDKGIDLFNQLVSTLAVEKRSVISGIEAFRLYDTYGFPIDLTILMARERGLAVDTTGFEEEMSKQKERARAASGFSHEKGSRPTGGEAVIASNEEERLDLARHHTGTHLLQAALRKVLGSHVTQAGSYVAPDRLRFDFTHFQGLTDHEVDQVEDLVNLAIMSDTPVDKYETSYEDAVAEGAMALFGEKYGSTVRVVRIGDFSKELCGGNHLDRTGQIGILKIISEGAVASGIRRIEAVAGVHALRYINGKLLTLNGISTQLKVSDDKAVNRTRDLLDQVKQQEKQIGKLNDELLLQSTSAYINQAQQYNGFKVIITEVPGTDSKSLLTLSDSLLGAIPSGLVFLASVSDGKVTFVAKASKDMPQHSVNCADLVKSAAAICGGGGGGSPVMAQAGGKLPENVGKALETVIQQVKDKLL